LFSKKSEIKYGNWKMWKLGNMEMWKFSHI
jgi:hypothetical protein